jgi:hypothetical protein
VLVVKGDESCGMKRAASYSVPSELSTVRISVNDLNYGSSARQSIGCTSGLMKNAESAEHNSKIGSQTLRLHMTKHSNA